MTADSALLLLYAFALKHFVIDFPLQFPYQYLNKGKYGHPGGIIHACLHGIGTFFVLQCFGLCATNLSLAIMAAEIVVHYHIDYLKVFVNRVNNLKPNTSELYWVLLGFDQLLHQVTYLAIVDLMV